MILVIKWKEIDRKFGLSMPGTTPDKLTEGRHSIVGGPVTFCTRIIGETRVHIRVWCDVGQRLMQC
jgi:hypothetical protein